MSNAHWKGHLLAAALLWGAVATASAQDWGPRSLEELKQEILHRAHGEGWRGVRPEDAERGVAELKSLERDHWAEVWSNIGEEYYARAKRQERSNPAQARDDYEYAWRLFNTGRWPTEKHSPGKARAYER